ncbi:hypothetical protein SA496_13950 [Pseudomonas sp. JS3066]|jgi:hypothetical protein|uniref:hypothetical protein n=1 Tax=unclassified Pseudomonas TaxID=196821 RepID=UPI000EAA46B6|nr:MULTISPECIES: hypothetical protein [unclassified Pseudomonas]AYF86338.1 hypothetical protein D6Z43_03830 [Pseudomonas sp. DY-1]MDH4653932.1 hypothetical protein [Pseudomonas sp. BN606]MRK22663.1 hypothetical protein [Pseudomonas sp. JG-B]WVK96207.1 hypothetical protein SA496_13950 [Pseudomonas sp. JS3066]
MNITSENRGIEVLFEELMPGFHCIVTRQEDGAINLQFESLASHKMIVLPAVDPTLWDTPEKLRNLCEQIAEEFAIFCEESLPANAVRPPSQFTEAVREKLYAVLNSLRGHA